MEADALEGEEVIVLSSKYEKFEWVIWKSDGMYQAETPIRGILIQTADFADLMKALSVFDEDFREES